MNAGNKIRLRAVSFLNARPITYGLERGLSPEYDRFDLSFDLPSRCAEALRAGEVDLALMPSASYALIDTDGSMELRAVPGIAVAGYGPVRTVLLIGDVPWNDMTEIALDGASRSSAMLLRLLCRDRGVTPRFREVPHDEILAAATGTTGALVIGDAGFEAATARKHMVDLGEEWRRVTGLPFVYALWVGREGVLGDDDVALLQRSLAEGLAHRREIASAWAEAHGGPPSLYERYLTDNIRFRLGAAELSGLAAFFDRMHTAGAIERAARARFFGGGAGATVETSAPAAAGNGAPARSVDALLSDAAAGIRLSPEDGIRL
jgi:cyclic dehypoxanthinyl futalosine synthase